MTVGEDGEATIEEINDTPMPTESDDDNPMPSEDVPDLTVDPEDPNKLPY